VTDYSTNIPVSALRTVPFGVLGFFFCHMRDALTSELYFKWVMVVGDLTIRFRQIGL